MARAAVTPDGGLRMGTPQGRWVLLATVLGSSLAMLDATVVNVALERIGTDLDAGFSGLQWTVNAYTLTLASLILLGGSLGRPVRPAAGVRRRHGLVRRRRPCCAAWRPTWARWLPPGRCRASGARC
jgi:MFS family permease